MSAVLLPVCSSSLQLFLTAISARCGSSEFSSLQWTYLPLAYAVSPQIHVNFKHLQYPVLRNYAVLSLCLKNHFLLFIWKLHPVNLIQCPLLLLLEDSFSPFHYQSEINKHLLCIPKLSLPN